MIQWDRKCDVAVRLDSMMVMAVYSALAVPVIVFLLCVCVYVYVYMLQRNCERARTTATITLHPFLHLKFLSSSPSVQPQHRRRRRLDVDFFFLFSDNSAATTDKNTVVVVIIQALIKRSFVRNNTRKLFRFRFKFHNRKGKSERGEKKKWIVWSNCWIEIMSIPSFSLFKECEDWERESLEMDVEMVMMGGERRGK